jgi:hypothetical protein
MNPTTTRPPAAILAERQIDDMLANSFPASDPPSWTSTGAETAPPDGPVTASSLAPARRATPSQTAEQEQRAETR